MSVLMLIHSLLNVLSTLQVASRSSEVNFTKNYTLLYLFLHRGIVPNYTNLVRCQFAMVISYQTVCH